MNYRKLIALAGFLTISSATWAADGVVPDADVDVAPLRATQRPLWELGFGAAGLRLPDYRGSDQSHSYLLPLPYIVYRGTWFKADREGARAVLFSAPRVKVDVSLGASTPARSSDNRARAGMPDLPATGEVGPSLNVELLRPASGQWKLDLRLPLRAAVTLERSPQMIGATFSPNVNLDLGAVRGWNVGLLTGPLFADKKYHQHFYQVEASEATAQRAAYQARGGYAGWQALVATSRRVGNAWMGAFVRYDNLSGAVFEDSPLVKRSSGVSVGFGVSWVFATSSEFVASTD